MAFGDVDARSVVEGTKAQAGDGNSHETPARRPIPFIGPQSLASRDFRCNR